MLCYPFQVDPNFKVCFALSTTCRIMVCVPQSDARTHGVPKWVTHGDYGFTREGNLVVQLDERGGWSDSWTKFDVHISAELPPGPCWFVPAERRRARALRI